jgi:hypothetical protein
MQEKAAVSWEHGYERVSIEPEALCIESPMKVLNYRRQALNSKTQALNSWLNSYMVNINSDSEGFSG